MVVAARRVDRLDALVDEIARELAPLYEDPAALAEYLVEIQWLTPFQRDTLFDGNPFDLTIGPYQLLSPLGEGGVEARRGR